MGVNQRALALLTLMGTLGLPGFLVSAVTASGCRGFAESETGTKGGGTGGTSNGGAGMVGGAAGGQANAGGMPIRAASITGQTSGTQPPSAYVAKVKRLLNGGVPTSDEVAMAKANPSALGPLIDSWMTHPLFRAKMLTFFAEALQQGGNSLNSLTDQFPNFNNASREWLDVVTDMFPLTAWDIVQADRPFTEVATTRRFMANTAFLVLVSFLELTPQESAKKDITVFNRPSPAIMTPTDFADSVQRKVFMLPDAVVPRDPLAGGCPDPAIINHDNFLRILLGTYHSPNCEPRRLSVPILSDADFKDWRLVEMRTRSAGEARTPYYDLPNLRKSKSIALQRPRVGFFTTPAFLARNATNDDNDFRVTTNQTLVVALGRAFDDEDVTLPIRTSALSAEHAVPGTVCWSCHVSLDPMRNYFANDFLTTFRAPAVTRGAETSFGFRDVTKDGGDMFTFAQIIANHPDFASGWTQRLCYWANSQPCDEDDPEFLRVKNAFVASKYKWKTLLRELMSSALVTGAAETKTQKEKNGTIVSITRRSHLCADIANRLDLPTVCKADNTLARFAAALPDDEYGRGATAPMQPTEPTLINSGSMAAVCDRLAALAVDGNAGTARVMSSNVEVSLDALVERVMGVPKGDDRFSSLRKILQDHLAAAKAAKASTSQAMRSAFSLACQSPTAAGIGL